MGAIEIFYLEIAGSPARPFARAPCDRLAFGVQSQ
jgi:hypothetical protein